MTTWKLPDLPGEIQSDDAAVFLTGGVSYVELNVPGVGRVTLPAEALTEMKPPMPEPPPGSVVLVDEVAVQRFDVEGVDYWAGVGGKRHWSWVQLVDLALPGTPVLLTLAPPIVTLPFNAHEPDDEGCRHVDVSTEVLGFVYVWFEGRMHLSPADTRTFAYALLTAADEADRRVSDATP